MAKLSENKVILLAIGICNGGYIRYEDAVQVYSAKDSAQSALQSLRAWGYISLTDVSGIFRVKKAPSDSFRMSENFKKEREDTPIKQTDDETIIEDDIRTMKAISNPSVDVE